MLSVCGSRRPRRKAGRDHDVQFSTRNIGAAGKLSIQPVLWEPGFNPDVDPNVTLVTGAFPAPGTNNIISGTGRFAGATGRVRLSGAATVHPDGSSTLDCIFIIDLFDDDDDDDDDGDDDAPDIAAAPTKVDFRQVDVGSSKDKTFVLKNDGTGDLKIDKKQVAGSSAEQYEILGLDVPVVLAPGRKSRSNRTI